MPYEEQLSSVPLFSRLERSDLARLAKAVVSRTFQQGEAIVNEGEQAVAFFVILKGRVEVSKGETRLAELGAGQFFGDMALLDGYPRVATVRALEPTECLVLSRWDFNAELRRSPNIAVAMLAVLSKRIRELEGEAVRW